MEELNNGSSDETATATKWMSIYVATMLSFCGAVQFSLYFSSMWPYLQLIDTSITEQFFGLIIAVYSLGQIASAPTFGYFSNRWQQVKLPLYIGLLMMLVGNAFYLAMAALPHPKYVLLVGRCITGFGSGNVVLLRTYACTASTFKDRHKAIAYITCGQAIGQVMGPAFQLIFAPLHYPGLHIYGPLYINLYSSPAIFACTINVFGALALCRFFKEEYVGLEEAEEGEVTGKTPRGSVDLQKDDKPLCASGRSGRSSGRSSVISGPKRIPPYDKLAAGVCCVTRFTQMFVQTNLETLGGAYSMMMFGWTARQVVIYTSIAQGIIGGLTLLTYIAFMNLHIEKYVSFRRGCVLALGALAFFHVVTYPWPFLPGYVPAYSGNASLTATGCNSEKFAWCNSLGHVNVYLYYTAYILLIGLAFPALNIKVVSLYSKVLGPRRQGLQQGVLQMGGGVARMLGPIIISSLYTAYGPAMAWQLELIVISGTIACWLLFYNRMVPLRMPKRSSTQSVYSIAPSQKEAEGSGHVKETR